MTKSFLNDLTLIMRIVFKGSVVHSFEGNSVKEKVWTRQNFYGRVSM